jgi:hypothetical protein
MEQQVNRREKRAGREWDRGLALVFDQGRVFVEDEAERQAMAEPSQS